MVPALNTRSKKLKTFQIQEYFSQESKLVKSIEKKSKDKKNRRRHRVIKKHKDGTRKDQEGTKKSPVLEGSKKTQTHDGTKKNQTQDGPKKSQTQDGAKKNQTQEGAKKTQTQEGAKKNEGNQKNQVLSNRASIRKSEFYRFVRSMKIIRLCAPPRVARYSAQAMNALHEASEAYLTDLFKLSREMLKQKAVTVGKDEIDKALKMLTSRVQPNS